MPQLRGNQFHICLAIQAHNVYGLCRPYRIVTAGALILARTGLSRSSTKVNAAAVMCASSWHTDTVTLVTVQLNVNQICRQQPFQQPVTGFCDTVPVYGMFLYNQPVFSCYRLE